jgi:hypothetical protein
MTPEELLIWRMLVNDLIRRENITDPLERADAERWAEETVLAARHDRSTLMWLRRFWNAARPDEPFPLEAQVEAPSGESFLSRVGRTVGGVVSGIASRFLPGQGEQPKPPAEEGEKDLEAKPVFGPDGEVIGLIVPDPSTPFEKRFLALPQLTPGELARLQLAQAREERLAEQALRSQEAIAARQAATQAAIAARQAATQEAIAARQAAAQAEATRRAALTARLQGELARAQLYYRDIVPRLLPMGTEYVPGFEPGGPASVLARLAGAQFQPVRATPVPVDLSRLEEALDALARET